MKLPDYGDIIRRIARARRASPADLEAAFRALLRGIGAGGQGRGRVRLIDRPDALFADDLDGAVAVCATLLPALAVALPRLAGLVTDHGGALSHAASLARELGVPAVVGTAEATRVLLPGELVLVDGEAGRVLRLSGR